MIDYIIGFIIFAGLLSGILLIMHSTKKKPDSGGSIRSATGGATIENTINALKKVGAKMYGAANCPYTMAQLEVFDGKLSNHNNQGIYIQCSVEVHSNDIDQRCQKYFGEHNNVNGTVSLSYPTWDINGQQHQGVQELHTLYSLATSNPSSGQHLAAHHQASSRSHSTSNTTMRAY